MWCRRGMLNNSELFIKYLYGPNDVDFHCRKISSLIFQNWWCSAIGQLIFEDCAMCLELSYVVRIFASVILYERMAFCSCRIYVENCELSKEWCSYCSLFFMIAAS